MPDPSSSSDERAATQQDLWMNELATASTKWLMEQLTSSHRLVHEARQLLRGPDNGSCKALLEDVRCEEVRIRQMREELDRRKAEIR